MRTARIVRIVVLAALVTTLASCITTTPGEVPNPDPDATYVGSQVCSTCHASSYASWTATTHSRALATLEEHGRGLDPACWECHTTGRGEEGGFASKADTPQLANVGCESCHGPGSQHVRNPEQVPLAEPLESRMCGECHKGPRYGTFNEWLGSAHAEARETVRGRPDECLACHSVEAILADGADVVDALQRETVVAVNGITCVVCHNPHGSPFDADLREAPEDVCLGCHTDRNARPGETPYYPQREVLAGIAGFEVTGDVAIGPNHSHAFGPEDGCVTCHAYKVPNLNPTAEDPQRYGHAFTAQVPDGCYQCHVPARDIVGETDAIQAEYAARIAALEGYYTSGSADYLDPAGLTAEERARYDIAVFNTKVAKGDGSLGIHNLDYIDRILGIAEDIFGALSH